MERIKRKTFVGWIAAVVAAAVLITTLSVGIFFINRENKAGRLTIENIYQENLYALSESLSNIEVNMSKLIVSNSNIETAVLLNDTYHHSMAASRAVGVLPLNPIEAHVTDRFLNQLGDWCLYSVRNFMSSEGEAVVASAFAASAHSAVGLVVRNNAENAGDTIKDNIENVGENIKDNAENVGENIKDNAENVGENIKDNAEMDADSTLFKNTAENIENSENAKIADIGAAKDNSTGGLATFDEQCEEFFFRTQRLNSAVKDVAETLDGDSHILTRRAGGFFTQMHLDDLRLAHTFGDSDKNTNTEVDLPQIIYDGPFSDGQNQKSFKCLEGKEELSEESAVKRAEQVFESLGYRRLTKVGETSSPHAYIFSGMTNKADMYVSVSVQGGMIISASLPCDNSGKANRLDEETAKQKAAQYAKMCGYDNLTPVWYTSAAGYAVVNFTPEKEGVIYYPDLVKVKVCLVTGDFAGIEALGYCASCHERNLSPAITREEAQKAVSSKLLINGARLALIPKNMKEHLCYEFAAEYKGMDYFVYIDAITGKQINIMRVMDGEQGKIVM